MGKQDTSITSLIFQTHKRASRPRQSAPACQDKRGAVVGVSRTARVQRRPIMPGLHIAQRLQPCNVSLALLTYDPYTVNLHTVGSQTPRLEVHNLAAPAPSSTSVRQRRFFLCRSSAHGLASSSASQKFPRSPSTPALLSRHKTRPQTHASGFWKNQKGHLRPLQLMSNTWTECGFAAETFGVLSCCGSLCFR